MWVRRRAVRACGTSLVRWMALQCAKRTARRLALQCAAVRFSARSALRAGYWYLYKNLCV